jgi:hypothetical protein
MSAIVAVVIGIAALLLGLPLVFTIVVANFIGGYIPYIGAFIDGGLAVIVAFGDGGLGKAAIMLVDRPRRQPAARKLRRTQGHDHAYVGQPVERQLNSQCGQQEAGQNLPS